MEATLRKPNRIFIEQRNTAETDERYCTVAESIIESCQQVRLMRDGKLPMTSWHDYMKGRVK